MLTSSGRYIACAALLIVVLAGCQHPDAPPSSSSTPDGGAVAAPQERPSMTIPADAIERVYPEGADAETRRAWDADYDAVVARYAQRSKIAITSLRLRPLRGPGGEVLPGLIEAHVQKTSRAVLLAQDGRVIERGEGGAEAASGWLKRAGFPQAKTSAWLVVEALAGFGLLKAPFVTVAHTWEDAARHYEGLGVEAPVLTFDEAGATLRVEAMIEPDGEGGGDEAAEHLRLTFRFDAAARLTITREREVDRRWVAVP